MMRSSSVLNFRNCRMVDPNEVEEMCFSTTIRDVPPYHELEPTLRRNASDTKEVVCGTGFLRDIDHSFNITFYKINELWISVGFVLPPNSGLTHSDVYLGKVRFTVREKGRPSSASETVIQGSSGGYASTQYGAHPHKYDVITDAQLDIYMVRKKRPTYARNSSVYGNVMLAKSMDKFLLSQEFSDATIECGDGIRIPVHRLILSGGSEYFGRMFANGMQEANSGLIRIEEFSSQCVKELLRFIYTGKPMTINGELCVAAEKYGLEELKILCETHLAEVQGAVTIQNALEVYEIGLLQRNRILQERAKKVISSNKQQFVKDPNAFKELTINFPSLMFDIFKV